MGCGSSRVVSYSEIDAVTSSVVVPSASVRVTSPAPSSSAFAKGVRNGVSTPLQDSSTAEVLSTSSTAPHQSTTTTAAVAGGSSVSGPLPSTRSRMQVVGVKQDTHTQYSCDARPILNGGGGDVTGKEDQDQIEGRNSDSLERERAATKIQAGVRGHHTRKELKAKKASRREKAATKIQPVLGGTKPERI